MADAGLTLEAGGKAFLRALKILSERHLGATAELTVELQNALESGTSEALAGVQKCLAALPDARRDKLLAEAHRLLVMGQLPALGEDDGDRHSLH